MAILKSEARQFAVPCRCLVGRSPLADLRINRRSASSEHASLGWYGGRWILRDLGSSNGTRVNGKRLFPGDRISIAAGSRIEFADDGEVWTVVDAEEPRPCAVLLGPQQYHWGAKRLLFLPSSEAPEASAFADEDGWRLDAGTELRSVETGDIVRLPSGYYRLLLTDDAGYPRARTAGPELDVSEISLFFAVTPERISVTIKHGATTIVMPSRACLNTLLALARVRMQSAEPELQRGWISSLDLAEMLHSGPEKINVDVHRLRKLFHDAGLRNAPRIVERDDAKRVRIGIQRLFETSS